MKKFVDKEGCAWELPLTIGDVFRVKAESEGKFNLFEPSKPLGVKSPPLSTDGTGKPAALAELLDQDDELFWEMLCHLMEPQLLGKEVTTTLVPVIQDGKEIGTQKKANFDAFGKLLAADCWPVVRKNFFEAWCDFFHSLQRPQQAVPLEKLAKYNAKALELVKVKLEDQRLKDLDGKVAVKMQSVLNKSFGDSLDSLDVILGPSPGENSTK